MKKKILLCLLALLASSLTAATKKLTAYPDMMALLKKLDASSPLVAMEMIGRSSRGRESRAPFSIRTRTLAVRSAQRKPVGSTDSRPVSCSIFRKSR